MGASLHGLLTAPFTLHTLFSSAPFLHIDHTPCSRFCECNPHLFSDSPTAPAAIAALAELDLAKHRDSRAGLGRSEFEKMLQTHTGKDQPSLDPALLTAVLEASEQIHGQSALSSCCFDTSGRGSLRETETCSGEWHCDGYEQLLHAAMWSPLLPMIEDIVRAVVADPGTPAGLCIDCVRLAAAAWRCGQKLSDVGVSMSTAEQLAAAQFDGLQLLKDSLDVSNIELFGTFLSLVAGARVWVRADEYVSNKQFVRESIRCSCWEYRFQHTSNRS